MSFTTIQLVKKHLTDHRLGTTRIEGEPFLMPASGSANLQYGNIQEGSEKIKAKEQNLPYLEELIFGADNRAALTRSELILDSVVVASNSSLGTIYVENEDYSIDYNRGTILRIEDGLIPSQAEFAIWYQAYRLYARGIDYNINYPAGTISYIASGDIEAGQMVFADYLSQYGNITDEAIANAIVEANAKVMGIIDPIYENSSDQSLVTAETYFTLSIICRIKAIETAGHPESAASGYSGDFWLKLKDSYQIEAANMLEYYAKPIGAFTSPILSKGEIREN